ncbi:MAG TPA: ecotin [Gammaproteobacteria bacterium]|nr:ecotin [Gammaproteobacteria bacterium]
MKPLWIPFVLVIGLVGGISAEALSADDLKPFPKPEPGYRRTVIRLPAVDVPDDRRVELILGKTLTVDCNRQFLSGELSRQVVPGWGYPYYVLQNVRGPASTLMACPPDEPKRTDLVRVRFGPNGTQRDWLPYNSKLPIVVYVPQDIEVQYRIWSPEPRTGKAPPE